MLWGSWPHLSYLLHAADSVADTHNTTTPCLFCCSSYRVGRLDNPNASPAGVLPASDMTLDGFVNFWTARGFTVEQGVALMGSHALLDEQGCYR